MYNNIELNKLFNKESEYAQGYNCGKISESRIKEAENNLGHKLPKSYIELLKIQNGGYVSDIFGDCWLRTIYGIGADKKDFKGIEELFDTGKVDWEYPDKWIPFGGTQSDHDWYVMDYSNAEQNKEPRILRIENEDNNATYFVANNFEEFIYMVYNNENIYGNLIVDKKKSEQQKKEKELDDIDGNMSVCKGLIFFAIIILLFSLFKQNWVVTAICIIIVLIIIPFWIKYEKKYKKVKNDMDIKA